VRSKRFKLRLAASQTEARQPFTASVSMAAPGTAGQKQTDRPPACLVSLGEINGAEFPEFSE